jgi:hypothetical protein
LGDETGSSLDTSSTEEVEGDGRTTEIEDGRLTGGVKSVEDGAVCEVKPTVTSVVNSTTVEDPYPRGTVWLRVTKETTTVGTLADTGAVGTPPVTVTAPG